MTRFIALLLLSGATYLLVTGPLVAQGRTVPPAAVVSNFRPVVGPSVAPHRPREPNPVVVPPYRATVRAAHRVHAEQTQLTCKDCHVAATASRQAQDWLGPSAKVCDRCHEETPHDESNRSVDRKTEACARCHLDAGGAAAKVSFEQRLERHPVARLTFSHATHAARNIGCGQCHGSVARRADAQGSERLPRKPSCLRCHRGAGRLDGEARAACITCHEAEGGRMRTRFGAQRLVPTGATPALEHGGDFRRTHRTIAGNDPQQCAGCHKEAECQACHDGRLRPRDIHPADWQRAHAIAAKQGENCSSCHRLQSFCIGCHQRLGLVSSGAPKAMAQRGSMHPPASVWTTGARGPNHHGGAAKRNLSECVSCHQERDCIRCHAAGTVTTGQVSRYGSGLNPHPPSFTANCRSYWARNPRPCLACHRPNGSEIQHCR